MSCRLTVVPGAENAFTRLADKRPLSETGEQEAELVCIYRLAPAKPLLALMVEAFSNRAAAEFPLWEEEVLLFYPDPATAFRLNRWQSPIRAEQLLTMSGVVISRSALGIGVVSKESLRGSFETVVFDTVPVEEYAERYKKIQTHSEALERLTRTY